MSKKDRLFLRRALLMVSLAVTIAALNAAFFHAHWLLLIVTGLILGLVTPSLDGWIFGDD